MLRAKPAVRLRRLRAHYLEKTSTVACKKVVTAPPKPKRTQQQRKCGRSKKKIRAARALTSGFSKKQAKKHNITRRLRRSCPLFECLEFEKFPTWLFFSENWFFKSLSNRIDAAPSRWLWGGLKILSTYQEFSSKNR